MADRPADVEVENMTWPAPTSNVVRIDSASATA